MSEGTHWKEAKDLMEKLASEHGWKYLDDYGVACPWIVNEDYTVDRVVAYHGFLPEFVGWDRGGPVWILHPNEVVSFLKKEITPNKTTHKTQQEVRSG